MAKKKDTQTQELFTQPAVPKMPEGYYSGDKPNPNLRAFVEQHLCEKPYDPANDDYDAPAFAKQIEATKATAIYNMHSYHQGKKPHDAIRQYIQHYTKPGDLVLDPFSGSGSTALAALIDRRKAIAIDRSPAATFITKNYCTPVDVVALKRELEKLKSAVESEINWLYETRCHLTDQSVRTGYTVMSERFQCPRCLEIVPFADCVQAEAKTPSGKVKTNSFCPLCHAKGLDEKIDTKSRKFGSIPVLICYNYTVANGTSKRVERRHNDSDPKARDFFERFDVEKLHDIERKQIPYWHPTNRMMNVPPGQKRWGDKWRAGTSNFQTVDELFTKRNLWALAVLRKHITEIADPAIREALLFSMTGVMFNCTRMYRERDQGRGTAKGNYYIPPLSREMVVTNGFYYKVEQQLIPAYRELSDIVSPQVVISTQSACSFREIEDSSIDYIFTDPPYADQVQYGELNFLWEAWMNFDTHWHGEEIIVNGVRGKSEDDWAKMMRLAMAECFRVLKPGRWLSLCYHDTSEGTWSLVQEVMADAGFLVDTSESTLFIDTGQKSYNQLTADKVNKRDLVINFRKPKPGEQRSAVQFTGAEDQQSFREKAQTVIREYLQANPGATKDRIYDQVVSRLVRRGQMEAHNFDELLGQVAEEVKEEVKKNLFENEEPDLLGTHQISRWHLKGSEAGADDAEQATTDSAGTRIHEFLTKTTAAKLAGSEPKVIELQAEIAARRTKLQAVDQNESDESRGRLVREIRELKEKLDKLAAQRAEWQQQALDYSQIFEFYVAAVNPKPKARLEEILEDYGYQTDAGNWRPPLTEQEKLEKGSERQQAVRRKIQRFCKLLEAGDGIPDDQRPDAPTLAAWIRHCRRTGSYAQGKLLYERGGLDTNALNEQGQVDVEEDYQVCVKHLERGKK